MIKRLAITALCGLGLVFFTGCAQSTHPTSTDGESGMEVGTVGGLSGGPSGQDVFSGLGTPAKVDTYVVRPGDTLWKISAKKSVYGTPWLYELIFHANSGLLATPGSLKKGMRLSIPRGQTSTELVAAKEEAMAAEYFAAQQPASATAQASASAAVAAQSEAAPRVLPPEPAPLPAKKGGGAGLVALGLAVLLAAGAAAYWYRRRTAAPAA